MTNLILVCAALVIFLIYNVVSIILFDVPTSLSDTYYLYRSLGFQKFGKKGRVLGYIFTLMMFSMAFLLMPAWLEITDSMGGWQSNLTVLSFLAAGAIVFVGAAPAFRNIGIENKIHMIAAKLCAVFAIAWCTIICFWYGIVIGAASIGLGWLFGLFLEWILAKRCSIPKYTIKFLKHDSDYWWEMCAFVATFITIIVQNILNIINQ